MLYDFVDAANGGGDDICVDDAEAEQNSKIYKGRIAPGKSTRGRGKGGSSTTSSELGEAAKSGIKLLAAVAENDEIEMVLVVQRNEDYRLGENEGSRGNEDSVWGKCRQQGGRD
ncbi:hypothetical protein V8G54_020938 [Vigna mungo]|uniref:Uncharacterized protein n=1 Tax=Vigna mungo TaxID=3915 RepID=A0AAQ3RV70_VIGMU